MIGSGKSNAVLVVSLLVSLMVDQVQKLQSQGAKASIISSSARIVAVAQELLATNASLQQDSGLFCPPESLMKSRGREALENLLGSSRIVAVIVHEAQSVSKW